MIGRIPCREQQQEIFSGNQKNSNEQRTKLRVNPNRNSQENGRDARRESSYLAIAKVNTMGHSSAAGFSEFFLYRLYQR
jgi:hypothetical protein